MGLPRAVAGDESAFEDGVIWSNARPHPGVDSLAPARSALRAFGSAEFLSPFPKRLKNSPPGEGETVLAFFRESSGWIGRLGGRMIR